MQLTLFVLQLTLFLFCSSLFFLEIICSALSKKEKRTSMFILKFDLLFMGNAERKKVVRMDGHLYKQVFPECRSVGYCIVDSTVY